MRTLLLLLLAIVCFEQGHAQPNRDSLLPARMYATINVTITKTRKPKRIYSKVEISKPLPGRDSSWTRALENRLDQTIALKRKMKPGIYVVPVRVLIERDGSLNDMACIDNPKSELCRQVIDAVKRTFPPRWGPPVRVQPFKTTSGE